MHVNKFGIYINGNFFVSGYLYYHFWISIYNKRQTERGIWFLVSKQSCKWKMNIEFKISSVVAWQVEPSENYVYIQNVSNGYFYELDSVGSDIWLGIAADKSLLQIEHDIARIYNTLVAEISQDIKKFILKMISNDLITIRSFE